MLYFPESSCMDYNQRQSFWHVSKIVITYKVENTKMHDHSVPSESSYYILFSKMRWLPWTIWWIKRFIPLIRIKSTKSLTPTLLYFLTIYCSFWFTFQLYENLCSKVWHTLSASPLKFNALLFFSILENRKEMHFTKVFVVIIMDTEL